MLLLLPGCHLKFRAVKCSPSKHLAKARKAYHPGFSRRHFAHVLEAVNLFPLTSRIEHSFWVRAMLQWAISIVCPYHSLDPHGAIGLADHHHIGFMHAFKFLIAVHGRLSHTLHIADTFYCRALTRFGLMPPQLLVLDFIDHRLLLRGHVAVGTGWCSCLTNTRKQQSQQQYQCVFHGVVPHICCNALVCCSFISCPPLGDSTPDTHWPVKTPALWAAIHRALG